MAGALGSFAGNATRMTWADFHASHADREWSSWDEFAYAIAMAGMDDTERQAAYRDWQVCRRAKLAGMSVVEYLNAGRANVKGFNPALDLIV
jgi:hypothetical protein